MLHFNLARVQIQPTLLITVAKHGTLVKTSTAGFLQKERFGKCFRLNDDYCF